jgi:hypothetical protein
VTLALYVPLRCPWHLLGQILIFSAVGPNPGSRPTLVHPTRPKYQREHNLPGPIETTWAQICRNWPELATQMLVGIRISKHLGSTQDLRDTMHVMEGMHLGSTQGLRNTMHVVECMMPPRYAEPGISVYLEPRLLQPPRARIVKLMELLHNLYKYKNHFRC